MTELEFDSHKPVKITISDPETGAIFETRILANDYAVIVAGNRYVKNVQIMGKTHMVSIAVAKPGERGASS